MDDLGQHSCIWKAELEKLQTDIAKKLEDFYNLNANNDEAGCMTLIKNLQHILKMSCCLPTCENQSSSSEISESSNQNLAEPTIPKPSDNASQVGNNPLIISKILSLLPLPDHLTCRQVDRQWRDLATSSMKKMNSLIGTMSFTFNSVTGNYETYEKYTTNLKQVTRYIEKYYQNDAHLFPITSFALLDGHLRTKSVRHFLYVYGKQVKTLRLRLAYDPSVGQSILKFVNSISKLFLRQARNLECLIFDGLTIHLTTPRVEDNDDEAVVQNLSQQLLSKMSQLSLMTLPNLKRLEIGSSYMPSEIFFIFIQKLLAAAPNLQQTIDFHLAYTAPFVEENKIFTIKKLTAYERSLYSSYDDMLEDLEKFSGEKSQLECLKLDLYYPPECRSRVGLALKKILTSSQHTLRRIEFIEDFAWLDPVHCQLSQFRLTNVKEILIGRALEDSGLVQPGGCLWAEVLPSLEKIHVRDFHQFDEDMWAQVFGSGKAPLVSVKILELEFDCTVDMIKIFGAGMPNLTHLKLTVGSLHMCQKVVEVLPHFFKQLQATTIIVDGEYAPEGDLENIDFELRTVFFQNQFDSALPVVDVEFRNYSGRLRPDPRSKYFHK